MAITDLTHVREREEQIEAPLVDIVAVHGLYEQAEETWIDKNSGVLWLRDLFPHKRYRARVLVYDYETKGLIQPGKGPADHVLPLAHTFVAELEADRQLDEAIQRPIIFICHGFGGLLVKRALAYSSSKYAPNVDHLRSIYVSTFAILFIGTPHNGVVKEALLLPGKHKTEGPSQFMLGLLANSEMLQDISDQFAPLMKRFAIFNFWELLETCSGKLKTIVVDENSAANVWSHTERCGVSATHSGMVKFSSAVDPGYTVIHAALRRYIGLASVKIRRRWENDAAQLQAERRHEAEALLAMQQPPEYAAEDADSITVNKWFMVPRCASTYFTGRLNHANFVRKKLGPVRRVKSQDKHRIFVVYGMGGSGKTQFCLKYVEDSRESYWGVFWIDASSQDSLELSFASIGREAGKGHTAAAGMHWLSSSSDPWLLIFDNADDPKLDLAQYFPAGNHGHILITTRNPVAIMHSTVGSVRFRGMEPDEAIALLLRSAFNEEDPMRNTAQSHDLASGIASELGYLALALAHAGATIRRRVVTLEKYLRYYLGQRKRLLKSPSVQSADEMNVVATWEIPFQRVLASPSLEYKDAVEIMHIFAFLHFESIPEKILQRANDRMRRYNCSIESSPSILQIDKPWNEEAQIRISKSIEVLCNYSFIEYDSRNNLCSFHPVIHEWARSRPADGEQKVWLDHATAVLASCISSELEASGREFRRMLLSHVDSNIEFLRARYSSLPQNHDQADALEKFASLYAENGLWKKARSLQDTVTSFRIKRLGRHHEATFEAHRRLGYILWHSFDIRECAQIQFQVLKSRFLFRPSVSSYLTWPPWQPKHLSYCYALDDLTATLWLAGKRDYSKYTGERAVNVLEKSLGRDDPITLTAMFNLARTYLHLGYHKKSYDMLVWVLKKRKHFFGPDHFETLQARSELGVNLCAQKRHLAVAERLLANVLESRRRILGEEHAYTLWSVNEYSKVLCLRKRVVEAVKILEGILPVVTRTLGDKHAGMFMTKANLVRAYGLLKRWREAEEVLEWLLKYLPKDHPDAIFAMYGLAFVNYSLDRKDDAKRICIETLEKIEKGKILTLDDPRSVEAAQLLFCVYREQGRLVEAQILKRKFPGIDANRDPTHFNMQPGREADRV